MTTTYCWSQSVPGALKNWRQRDWEEIGVEYGCDPSRIKARFKLWLLEGKKVIPLNGKPCEGWSYDTGCPGHPVEVEQNANS